MSSGNAETQSVYEKGRGFFNPRPFRLRSASASVAASASIVIAASEAAEQKNPDQNIASAAAVVTEQVADAVAASASVVSAAAQKDQKQPDTVVGSASISIAGAAGTAVCCSQITHWKYLQISLQCIVCQSRNWCYHF